MYLRVSKSRIVSFQNRLKYCVSIIVTSGTMNERTMRVTRKTRKVLKNVTTKDVKKRKPERRVRIGYLRNPTYPLICKTEFIVYNGLSYVFTHFVQKSLISMKYCVSCSHSKFVFN